MSESGGDPALIHRTIAGKFVVEKFLGGGAMGAVYRAHQVALDRKVAVKVMHRSLATDEAFVKRFKREAKAASKLDHPNSMRIIDYGEEPDGLLYIAMEYLEGRDLFRVIHESWRDLTNERIADVLMQALAAIAVAHDQGVIHRDLKPENIMILKAKDDEGDERFLVKVCDFGIAKITESDEPASTADPASAAAKKLTTQGLVVGTPEYMSPEQARGEKLDARSDLYSLGIILYQLLTGRTPFVAETPLAVVLKHIGEEPKPPHEIYPGVHKALETVCLRAIAKDREERYQSAREMRAAVRAAVDGKSIPAPALAHAPTEPLLVVGASVKASSPPGPLPMPASSKVTPLGTEAAPAAKRRGAPAIAVVLVLGVAAGAGAMVYMKRSHAAKAVEPAIRHTEKSGPEIAPPSGVAKESPPTSSSDPAAAGSVDTKTKEAKEHARTRDLHELASKRDEPAASVSVAAPSAESPSPPSPPEAPPQAQNAPPAAPVFDPKKCHVTLAKPQHGDRVRLASFEAAWNKCAHESAEKPPALLTPRLHYDEEGRVRVASCADCPAAMKACVERARGKLAPTGESGDFDVPLNVGCE